MAEGHAELTSADPISVVHLIDGLGGGGSERWVWDIVRLSEPTLCKHFVISFFPDNAKFVYSEPLRSRGAYKQPAHHPLLEWLERGIQTVASQWYFLPIRKTLSGLWWFCNAVDVWWRVAVALVQKRPDVIHVHTFHGLRVGLVLRRMLQIPLVHSVPALFSQMTDAGFHGIPQLYRSNQQWVARFITGASVAELHSIGIPDSKIMPIHGTVDLTSSTSMRKQKQHYYTALRDELKLPGDAVIALSVGRLHPSKGHAFALEAVPELVAQFPQLHWVVLGEGEQREALEARASELKVREHVHLLGFQRDPLPYYAAADIYLRTPVFESENLSSYQAMAMGLPVVGFDTGCETELLGKSGHGVLVPARNSEALAKAVVEMLSLPDRGARIGLRGVEYCRQHLDIDRTISDLVRLYQHLGAKRA